ncbi:hypothetical protein PRIPAC_81321 [Pristionchus pacificus]|nr:hypothetical protein PRIPAC_81321 [Pristionchus pacificus]
MVLTILFSLLITISDAQSPRTIEWCNYWSGQGINRPECFSNYRLPLQFRSNPSPVVHWSFNQRLSRIPSYLLNNDVRTLPSCSSVQNVAKCIKSHHCLETSMCWENNHACCTPLLPIFARIQPVSITPPFVPPGCPLPQTIDYRCMTENPISWCTTDVQCTLGEAHKCCPTGCGNRICINTGPIGSSKVIRSSLPLVDVSCVEGAASWCENDRDCRSSSARRRVCRSTKCGHNVCLLQFGSSWIVA